MSQPRVTVPGEPRIQVPFGLFSVLKFRPTPADPHWEASGIQFESIATTPASGISMTRTVSGTPPVSHGSGLPKSWANNGYVSAADSFTLYGSYEGAAAGHTIEWAFQQASAQLLAREQEGVERTLWTGELGNSPAYLTDTVLLGTDLDPFVGLGLLEDWLGAEYGSLGVIHMRRSLAMAMVKNMLLQVVGGRLQTFLGTPIVAGGGYPNTDPNGDAPAANHAIMYATPNLIGYRSEVFDSTNQFDGADLFDRSYNNIYAVAERNYVVAWDEGPGTAYVDVNLLAPVAD